MGFIYMLTSPSGKSYIGQTIRPIGKRLSEHPLPSSECIAIRGAIQKYGWENFEKDWYEVPDDELNKHEELMVEVLGTLVPSGYNLREGGDATGKPLTDEHKKKISESMTGEKNHFYEKTHTEESKKKISESLSGEKAYWYGKTLSEETKQKLSETNTGKTCTEETKQKIGKARLGKTHTEESKQKMSKAKSGAKNHRSKTVYRYTIDGTYVDWFGSFREAARRVMSPDENEKNVAASIGECVRGECNYTNGFRWSSEKMDHLQKSSVSLGDF
jgi:group I intron endonuclease